MSRRRSSTRAQTSRFVSTATVVATSAPIWSEDAHQLALERRSARAAERELATSLNTVDADELHHLAVERLEYRMGRGPRPAGMDVPRSIVTEDGTISVTLPVMGMTCRSCEVRIARHIGRLPNVEKVTASAVHGRVVVESSAPVSPAAIEQALNKAGYEIGRTPWLFQSSKVQRQISVMQSSLRLRLWQMAICACRRVCRIASCAI